MLSFAGADGSGSGVAGPMASVGAICDTVSGGGDTRLAFFTNSGIDHLERMCVYHDGNVGIGTRLSYEKLDIRGSSGTSLTDGNRKYFSATSPNDNTTFNKNTGTWSGAGIYATSSIVSGAWIAAHSGTIGGSDERIKKEIVDVEDGAALETLRLLKPKQYKYKDVINRGDEPVWGFIAQEVGATLPYATQLLTDCLPNIYELANVSNSNVITFTNFDTSNLESNAMVLKVFDKDDTEHLVNIAEVVDEHSVRVDEDLSEWTEDDKIFVYGQQVDDFVFLKKDAIWTVATSALQEVDRQLQAEKIKVATLETQLASVLTRLDALENA